MNELRVDERFSKALEAELVSRVQKSGPARNRRHAWLWLSTGALAGAGLLGGIGAATAGLFTLPGGENTTPLASPSTTVHTGTATVELGEAPEGTTGIAMELTCLSAGRFEWPDGAASLCSAADAASPTAGWSGYTISLTPGQHSVTIKTEPESRWKLTARYVKQARTEWGVNAKGETYGVESPEKGTPDLVAVTASNGASGYAYAKDRYGGPTPTSPEDAARNFSTTRPPREIPVYLSDGQTKVGTFQATGSGGGIPADPSHSP
ncbi:peptidase M56 family protein [Arthrobacter sp. NPDC056691]|uniref:peptidase M56 family protein n=1 Tax=Arthrobacter sp. NPDC056691 TaxID=3345913 RepID=UPI0036719106